MHVRACLSLQFQSTAELQFGHGTAAAFEHVNWDSMIVILQVVKRNSLEIRLLISHTYIAMNTGACVAAYSFGSSQCCPASSPPRRPFTIVMVDAPVASKTEWLLSKMKWVNELMRNAVSEPMNENSVV
eukprot:COSAG03_NODE_6189_length_1099_cov_10.919000_1_plen_129_part_00